ncbi:hypothetical protein M5E87_10070 [Flavonifractor plautii]|nr:hypothetical protein M5E87_10070 [Flavonifractor plautii]
MLSGCGGLDGAVFTVAADEGPMPQTAEHLDILSLLGLERGWSPSPGRIWPPRRPGGGGGAHPRPDGRHLPGGAPGSSSPPSPARGWRRCGPPWRPWPGRRRPAGGQPRLHVDRVFSVDGSGTVVTGTLTGGPSAGGQGAALSGRADRPGTGPSVPRRPGGGAAPGCGRR